MIEFSLEKFPVRQSLTNGVQTLIRPLDEGDAAAFTQFHESIPGRERFLLKHRLTNAEEI